MIDLQIDSISKPKKSIPRELNFPKKISKQPINQMFLFKRHLALEAILKRRKRTMIQQRITLAITEGYQWPLLVLKTCANELGSSCIYLFM